MALTERLNESLNENESGPVRIQADGIRLKGMTGTRKICRSN